MLGRRSHVLPSGLRNKKSGVHEDSGTREKSRMIIVQDGCDSIDCDCNFI